MHGCLLSGGLWLRMQSNFSNVLDGIFALLEMASTEGWIDVM